MPCAFGRWEFSQRLRPPSQRLWVQGVALKQFAEKSRRIDAGGSTSRHGPSAILAPLWPRTRPTWPMTRYNAYADRLQ